jgi:hypothetical protein
MLLLAKINKECCVPHRVVEMREEVPEVKMRVV